MKEETKKPGGLPLVIIVAVLALVVVGAWWMYNSSKGTTSNTNRAAQANKTAPTPSNAPPGATPPNMLGSPSAAVTVEEFADFQCPSCGATHPIMKQIQGIYGSRIKFIFRHFPLQMHDKAFDASSAAEAAGMQGADKFWAMHNQLYTNQQSWSTDPNYKQVFKGYAEKIGLNTDQFEKDMAGIAARSRVQADVERGRALSINQTPTVFINGKSIPYSEVNVNSLRQIIDAELQNANSGQQAPAAANAPAPANAAPANK
jgi:protein-disulfide isomerase